MILADRAVRIIAEAVMDARTDSVVRVLLMFPAVLLMVLRGLPAKASETVTATASATHRARHTNTPNTNAAESLPAAVTVLARPILKALPASA